MVAPSRRLAGSIVFLSILSGCIGSGGIPEITTPFPLDPSGDSSLCDLVTLPPAEHLEFDCSVAGIHAGRAGLNTLEVRGERVLRLDGGTQGLLDLLFPVSAQGETRIPADGSPASFWLRSVDRGAVQERKLRFGEVVHLWWREGAVGAGREAELHESGCLDPLRILEAIRCSPIVEDRAYPMLSSARRQCCRVLALGSKTIPGMDGQPVEVEVLELRLGWDHDQTDPDSSARCSVWWLHLGRDSSRIPYLLEHDTPLGRLRIELVERQVGSQPLALN